MKLAKVEEVTSDGIKIKFDGENTASEQLYTRVDSYTPTINDRVILGEAAGTYVIMGKVVR